MYSSCLSNVGCLSYFDYSKYDLVHKVFDTMRKRDVVAWNTMVSWYVKTGRYVEAIRLFRVMMKMGIKPSPVSFVNVFPAFSSAGDLKNAYVLYGMLAKMGSEYVNDLFCCELGDIHALIFSLKAVETEHTVLDDVTFLSALTAVSQLQCLDLAQQLHGFNGMDDEGLMLVHEMQNQGHGIQFEGMDGYLIDMYAKCGLIRLSQRIFERSNVNNRDQATWNAMIAGYTQHGLVEAAFVTFRQMLEKNVMPKCSCSHSGLVDDGLQIFESMEKDFKIQPSAPHYCCVTDMLGRVGRVVEAYEFVKQLGEAGHVLEIWGSLLAACRLHEYVELGEVVAKKLLEMEKIGNITGYHVLLSNIYAEEGNWVNADKVRKEMREKGLQKEVGSSWIDIGALEKPSLRTYSEYEEIVDSSWSSTSSLGSCIARRSSIINFLCL
ncbi:hypothetical protein OIU84_011836 [Salix udensis]|uniref:Pentatricopeptide repeat-containing protein n=1 Tax=Salix udensis TaxID=889485 RepID=A0AAD6NXE7_9ROSI|nr:hypothetical protein OIU84_011836 [Salix udensis]